MTARADLTGKTFGKLTAIRFERTTSGRSGWLTRCECGNEKVIETSNLTCNSQAGCLKCGFNRSGNKRRSDLAGKTFGKLTAIEYHPANGKSAARWRCRCECGNEHFSTPANLNNGRGHACKSCSVPMRLRKKRRHIAGDIPNHYWKTVLNGAIQRNIDVQISAQDAYDVYVKQDGRCALTGLPIGFRDRSVTKSTASLDRIDSKKCYSADNIQWVHFDVNIMKNHFGEEYFISMCRKIVEKDDIRKTKQGAGDTPA